MEFLHASIALLASMVLVLAAMVGWLYWQQTRLFQNMNSIVMIVGELARAQAYEEEVAPVTVEEVSVEQTPAPAPAPVEPEPASEEDDRVSVEAETIEGPPGPIDTDDLEGKSTKELKDMLTKRGIPFGKRDSKGVLISLLKATA
jgi:hypothetical protein